MLLNDEPEERREDPIIVQARTLLREGRAAEAAAMIGSHLHYAPAKATEYELLGIAYAMAGETAQAINALEQATRMDGVNAEIHYNLGLAYRKAARPQDALTEFERAVHLQPNYEAAKRALEATRRGAVGLAPHAPGPGHAPPAHPPAAGHAAPVGQTVRCPHCG